MSDNEYYRLWNEFGRDMNTVAILTLLSIVTGVTGFVAMIFVLVSLGNIKRINAKVKSLYLYDFHKKMVSSFIIKLISFGLLGVGIVGIVFSSYFWFEVGPVPLPKLIFNIILSCSPAVIGLILFIVGFSMEMKAWGNLKLYIAENRSLFPEHVAKEVIDGADKLRTAALMFALGFLGVTLIIGFIFLIIGFFKLAKLNNVNSMGYSAAQKVPVAPQAPKAPRAPVAPEPPFPSPVTVTTDVNRVVGVGPKFCPNCGAEILEGGGFCPDCGSSIS